MTIGAIFTLITGVIVFSVMLGGVIGFAVDCIKYEGDE